MVKGHVAIVKLDTGAGKLVTVTGCPADVLPGEHVRVEGEWSMNRRFGQQLKARQFERVVPDSEESVLAYLLGGAVKGVGPVLGRALVNRFGKDTLTVLADTNMDAQLLQVPRIGPATLMRVRASLAAVDSAARRDFFKLITQQLGLSTAGAQRLWNAHGADAEDKIRNNPYLLIKEFSALGFTGVDALAITRLGFPPNGKARATAAIEATLARAASSSGHSYLLKPTLLHEAMRLLSTHVPAATALKLAQRACEVLVKEGRIHVETPHSDARFEGAAYRDSNGGSTGAAAAAYFPPCVYSQELAHVEVSLAAAIRRRLPPRAHAAVQASLEELSALLPPDAPQLSAQLSDQQREAALHCALQTAHAHNKSQPLARIFVLTGGPGTGKTFTVREVVRQWVVQRKRVLMACPTARAAAVLSDAVGLKASTIHRLLKFNPQTSTFGHDALNPLEADAVVVDEASMLDVSLAAALFAALPDECVVLVVGDADQLPSVGPGAVLRNLLSSGRMPSCALSTIYRQDPAGDIAKNAALINAGRPPTHLHRCTQDELPSGEKPSGCFMVSAQDANAASEIICGRVIDWLESHGFDVLNDVQVLSPQKLGAAGTHQLNYRLKQRLNPREGTTDSGRVAVHGRSVAWAEALSSDSTNSSRVEDLEILATSEMKQSVLQSETIVSVGDPVVQLVNDYNNQVFNGDAGVVTKVSGRGTKSFQFTVRFDGAEQSNGDDVLQVVYSKGALGRVVALSYAMTVHKAQGSEYSVVVMPVVSEHGRMLYRKLLYTGVSRAKSLLVFVGVEAELARAAGIHLSLERNSLLAQRIGLDCFAPPTTRHL